MTTNKYFFFIHFKPWGILVLPPGIKPGPSSESTLSQPLDLLGIPQLPLFLHWFKLRKNPGDSALQILEYFQ